MGNREDDHVRIRHDLRPGDPGRVTALHAILYAREHGFDPTFEAYVAETLAELSRRRRPERDRLWLAERAGTLVGSTDVVGREDGSAQLRWVLVDPDARGHGLARRLVEEALAFCRAAGYRSVFLWAIDPLLAAGRRYEAVGFPKTEVKPPAPLWGSTLSEERYDMSL